MTQKNDSSSGGIGTTRVLEACHFGASPAVLSCLVIRTGPKDEMNGFLPMCLIKFWDPAFEGYLGLFLRIVWPYGLSDQETFCRLNVVSSRDWKLLCVVNSELTLIYKSAYLFKVAGTCKYS